MPRLRNRIARAVFVLLAIPTLLVAAPRRRSTVPPRQEVITILQTTDIHHHANGSDHVGLDVDPVSAMSTTGAYARIAAYVGQVRATAQHPVILVDSGDWTMGTLYDLTLGARPMGPYFLSAMRYDAVTLGNHEFDYTPKGLAQMLSLAQSTFGFSTPIVQSNMSLGGNADLASFVGPSKAIRPTYVETLSTGTKVGFIGLMGEEAAVDAPNSAPVSFTPLSSSYAAIQSLVDDLRNNQGAQIVVALSHSGTDASGTTGEDVELARHVHGINVIAAGHTHTPLNTSHSVTASGWTTHIINAGAFGTNVTRLDLVVDRSNGVTTPLQSFANVAMTNGGLSAVQSGLAPDATTVALVNATDRQLNATLSPFLTTAFADYDSANLGKGIYHPVGVAAQAMFGNESEAVLAPNGLGNLAADSVRNVPNAIIAQTLAAAGGNPAAVPGYDFTPVQLGVVATGVIRSTIPAGVPITFADVYNVLPLGITPDSTQALPIGYPLMSAYVDSGDLKKIIALQLVAQCNLVSSQFYLNLSGVQYALEPTALNDYFKFATAAAVLQITNNAAAGGSTAAAQALGTIFVLGTDHGTALLAAAQGGNPFASAMVKLNDSNPDAAQTQANLTALGTVAATALYGTNAVNALVVSKAVSAIGTISGFSATDTKNTGTTTALDSTKRVRVAADLYAILLLGAVKQQFGIEITPYQAATGSTTLSSADMVTLLGNRIDAQPGTAGVQELKEWMALLSNIGTGLGGQIGPEYKATSTFTEFPAFGAAVTTRNASYPLAQIGRLVQTMASLY